MSEEIKKQEAWSVSKSKQSGLKKEAEKAVMLAVVRDDVTDERAQEFLDELAFLAYTAGADVVKQFTQRRAFPRKDSYMGSGKLEEVAAYVEKYKIDLVLIDDDLSPVQQNNLEEVLGVKVVDRSTLILDIFADRAQTAQAKTQVELAQLQYLLPRLRGMWTHLERQRGGIGMRGPGEKEIETDRRIVRDKISLLKTKLDKIDRQNATRRKQRGERIRVSLVGYTNAGKSTIMNLLSKSDVFAENKLFATLDTTVRKVVIENMPFLLSDTVGFIRKLPHHLIESFKSTLDEVRESDLLIHVVDISHPNYEDHIEVVHRLLQEMEVDDKPMLIIFNKMDAYQEKSFDDLLEREVMVDLENELKDNLQERYQKPCLFISALEKDAKNFLKEELQPRVRELYRQRYPYQEFKYW